MQPKNGHHIEPKLVSDFIRHYSAFNWDGMVCLLHLNIRFVRICLGEVLIIAHGLNEFKTSEMASKSILHKRCITILKSFYNNNDYEVHASIRQLMKRHVFNPFKIHNSVHLQKRMIFRFRDNKIIELIDIVHYDTNQME